MERMARFSIAKVRKNLLPSLLRKTVQEYTKTGKRKRRRGGVRRQTFNPEHNIKIKDENQGDNDGSKIGKVPPSVAAFSNHANADSPMSTLTPFSGFKDRELYECARRHFGRTKEPIVFNNIDDMILFTKKCSNDEGTAIEPMKLWNNEKENNPQDKLTRYGTEIHHPPQNIQDPTCYEAMESPMPKLNLNVFSCTDRHAMMPFQMMSPSKNGTEFNAHVVGPGQAMSMREMQQARIAKTAEVNMNTRLANQENENLIPMQMMLRQEQNIATRAEELQQDEQEKDKVPAMNNEQQFLSQQTKATEDLTERNTKDKRLQDFEEDVEGSAEANDVLTDVNSQDGKVETGSTKTMPVRNVQDEPIRKHKKRKMNKEQKTSAGNNAKKLITKEKKKTGTRMKRKNQEEVSKTKKTRLLEQDNYNKSDINWNAKYDGKLKCKDKSCTLEMETEQHEGTLWNRYGPRMKCSECQISLVHAMKKSKLAMVCQGCKDKECRFMRCLECNTKKGGKRTRRSSRISNDA